MPRTSWAGPCRSWFKGGTEDGPVTALHPGSRIHFFHMLEQFRGEDWEFVYEARLVGIGFRIWGMGFRRESWIQRWIQRGIWMSRINCRGKWLVHLLDVSYMDALCCALVCARFSGICYRKVSTIALCIWQSPKYLG
jgi:hypothetical protein